MLRGCALIVCSTFALFLAATPARAQFSGYSYRSDAGGSITYTDENFEFHLDYDDTPNGGIGLTGSSASISTNKGSASASSSLASGELHAFAFSTGGKAEAGAILAETLNFTSALDHNEIVPFHFFVDGVLSEAFASATFEYWVTGMSFSSINTLLSGDNDFLYGMVIPAGQSQTIKVYTVLGARVQPSINMYSDYSHTAKIRLDLPTGITFTSASGTFLTAVPEPACLGLVAAVALGMTRRRRR